MGLKQYELSNHLGNVLVTVSDHKQTDPLGIAKYQARVINAQDYYPFGMLQPNRVYSDGGSYRFGFNGMEADDEVKGGGNSYTAQYWQYDSRIGRRWNVDVEFKRFPMKSSYQTFSNNPIIFIDPNGDADYYSQSGAYLGNDGNDGDGRIVVVTDRKLKKAISKADDIGNSYPIPDVSSGKYFEIPSYEDRQIIKNITATLESETYREVGGRKVKFESTGDEIHLRAKDGNPAGPDDDSASIYLGKIHEDDISKISNQTSDYGILYTWHSHPNGEWTLDNSTNKFVKSKDYKDKSLLGSSSGVTLGGSNTTKFYAQTPSLRDLKNAVGNGGRSSKHNFVISRKSEEVYYYTDETLKKGSKDNNEGKFNLDKFYNVKEGDRKKD